MKCCDKADLPCVMDAPDGPECHCGKPSALECGVCADCAGDSLSAEADLQKRIAAEWADVDGDGIE
jgi:hypothetical protein